MRVLCWGFVLCISLPLGGCPHFQGYEPPEASCLNDYARVNYGTVRETAGGFEVGGNPGPVYAPMEVTQPAWSTRPATYGDPADDYPKSQYRELRCKLTDKHR